ncbi:MAG: response regulator [Tissierellaceae bacterium]
MRVILVDDEPIALEVLERRLEKYSYIDLIGSYRNPMNSLGEIVGKKPDAIFLDIEMGEINGLEFAEILMEKLGSVDIVFVTAYSQYAVDAFEFNAIDYLLKPIQENRLEKTLERLVESTKKRTRTEKALRITSFASFQALDGSGEQLTWRTQKSKELFAYLWHNQDRIVPKAVIMETIFPQKDLDKATTLLHTTVYQLRKGLEKLGYQKSVIYLNDGYRLDIAIDSDLKELNRILGLDQQNECQIETIIDIYKGDFLEEEAYDWAVDTQLTVREKVLAILYNFSNSQLKENIGSKTLKSCLDKIGLMDPFNEDMAEITIKYYGQQHKRYNLENFFKEYKQRLWEEMSLKPMDSTTELYNKYI